MAVTPALKIKCFQVDEGKKQSIYHSKSFRVLGITRMDSRPLFSVVCLLGVLEERGDGGRCLG